MSQKITIVALHGFCGSAYDFQPLIDLCSAKHKWLCPDISSLFNAQWGFDNFVTGINKLLDAHELTNAVFLGYSMGGRLALHYALNQPQRVSELILVGAHAGLSTKKEQKLRKRSDEILAQKAIKHGVPYFIDYWQKQPLIISQSKNISASVFAEMINRRYQLPISDITRSLRFLGLGRMPNQWPNLEKLTCKSILVSGQFDEKFCEIAKKMGKIIPQSQVVQIAKVGHAAHLEDSHSFLSQLSNYTTHLF